MRLRPFDANTLRLISLEDGIGQFARLRGRAGVLYADGSGIAGWNAGLLAANRLLIASSAHAAALSGVCAPSIARVRFST
ncbi:MAG TPA: hypothetical protein VF274_09605, partial [Alphaproteobacteria bacterium]